MLSSLLGCLLIFVFIRETNSGYAFKSFDSSYMENERLVYPLAYQLAKEKLRLYSNNTGITIDCPLDGKIQWIKTFPLESYTLSEKVVKRIPDLLEPLANGSLVIKPFPPSSYREDVHNISIYCLATNSSGAVVSAPQRVSAILTDHYEISASDAYVVRGSTAVLNCQIPISIRPYMSFESWIVDSEFDSWVTEIVGHSDKYSVSPNGELYIRDFPEEDIKYRCKIRNLVNNHTVLSSKGGLIIVRDIQDSFRPRAINCLSTIVVEEGTDSVGLPCAAQAEPAPTYTWYKLSKINWSPHQLASDQSNEYLNGSLILRNVSSKDANNYMCVATNRLGEAKCETQVITFSPLVVNIESKKIIVNLKQRAVINCTLSGYPRNQMIWIHNGRNVLPENVSYEMQFFPKKSILIINAVEENDQGIWQCLALNSAGDSAIDTTQLIVDIPPYFIDVFDQKYAKLNDKISMKCEGMGDPLPLITWTLDGIKLEDDKRKTQITNEYNEERNSIVSYLNITIWSVYDEGVYECIIKNRAGISRHSAKLKVSGPTKIKYIQNKNFTAMNNISVYCPAVGEQHTIIDWHKDDKILPLNHRHRVHSNGTLEINDLDKSDSGIYSCIAYDKNKYEEFGKQSFKMRVIVPPMIQGFYFDNQLQTGMRSKIFCNIAQGDQPIQIQFFKDDKPINRNNRDGIVVEKVDPLSLSLTIANLTSKHSGNYSCIATNEAKNVSYSSYLLVKAPPKWLIEPNNTHAVEGNNVRMNCSVDGLPTVQITWKRVIEKNSRTEVHPNYLMISNGPKYHVFRNGTLVIRSVGPYDESEYLCLGSNGIGPDVSKIIKLFVHIPVQFIDSNNYLNITVRQNHSLELVTDIIGDHPIGVKWSHNSQNISQNSKYLIEDEIKEMAMTSTLRVKSVTKDNSGVYEIIAVNPYSKKPITKTYNVVLHGTPDPPLNIAVTSKSSHTAELSWIRPIDGNDPIKEFIIEYKDVKTSETKKLSVSGNSRKGVLSGLLPFTEYSVVMRSINSVDKSKPSNELKFITEEESPSSPPNRIKLTALNSTSIRVEWYSPPDNEIKGELMGFYVGYKTPDSSDPFIWKTVEKEPNQELDYPFSTIIHGLKPYTNYSVIVQTFNKCGVSPRSDPLSVRTDASKPSKGPTDVRCKYVSSESITISWNRIPEKHINGVLKGYRVDYKPVNNKNLMTNEVTAKRNQLTLNGLQENTNYLIAVNGFNQIGNSESSTVFCKTQRDDQFSNNEKNKTHVVEGNSVKLVCSADVYPNGQITWKKVVQSDSDIEVNPQYIPISNGTKYQVFKNGTLEIKSVEPSDESEYLCTSSNGSGPGVSKIVKVFVDIPVKFKESKQYLNISIKQMNSLELVSDIIGDHPISVKWTHNSHIISVNSEYLIENSVNKNGMTSILRVNSVTNKYFGIYESIALNAFSKNPIIKTFNVRLQEIPDPPLNISLASKSSHTIELSWLRPYEGIDPIKEFIIRYKESKKPKTKSLSVVGNTTTGLLSGLHPFTEYSVVMLSINGIDKSKPSNALKVITEEDLPSAPPTAIKLIALNDSAIRVQWYSPPPHQINGELKGFNIGYKTLDSSDPFSWISVEKESDQDLYSAFSSTIQGLRPSTQYSVIVQAFNKVGASPRSDDKSVRTHEVSPSGPPTRVKLIALNASSIRVEWYSPPPLQINGELKGFYIGYKTLNSSDPFFWKIVEKEPNQELDYPFSTIIHGLKPYTNYSVTVQAFNKAGVSPYSDGISVRTGQSRPSHGPTGVSCESVSSQSITVSWDSIPEQHINGVLKGYRVDYKPTNNKDLMTNEVTAQRNQLTLNGLQENTNYSIAVKGFNEMGNSDSSTIFCKTEEEDLSSEYLDQY